METNPPLVTIMVLSYRHEAFIERCLLSVIHQTFRDFELIFVDNCSPDNTFERGIAVLKDSGIRYHAERTADNIGCVRGMNYGLKNFAQGKYITGLAGDDWWDIEHLAYKVPFMESNPQFGMVYGNGYSYNNATEEIALYYKTPSISGWILRDLLKAPNINPEGIMYHHDVLRKVDYYDEDAKVEDRDLWYRVARETQVGYLHRALTYYRVNHGGNVSANIAHMREGNEYFFRKYENEFPQEIREARLKQYQYFADYLATTDPGIRTLKFLIRNYRFDWLYTKQIAKCLINMVRKQR